MLSLLDLTSLGDSDDDDTIRELCRNASTVHGPVAAVCVWPRFVPLAHQELQGCAVRIAAVANFPEGISDPGSVAHEAAQIVADGGHEVDVVYPWRQHLATGREGGLELVSAVRNAVGEDIVLKVILETGELDDLEIVTDAARAAVAAGADFLKTSTGKVGTGATPEAVRALLAVASEDRDRGGQIGVKVSGGVRDLETAAAYLRMAEEVMGTAWPCVETMRFGASSLLGDLLAAMGED